MSRPSRRRPRPSLPPLPGPGTAAAVVVLAIVLLAGATHLPLRHAGYVQDDHVAVENNPIVARGDPAEIFGTDYWAGAKGADRSLYRPSTIFSFALERKLSGGEAHAALSHAINVFLHVLATVALLALALRLGFGLFASSAAALLFAVHPLHVEAIAGIVGRAEILAALFTFLALLAQSAAGAWFAPGATSVARPGLARRVAASWGAALFVFLALTSKESAVAAPFLLLLLELLFRPDDRTSPGRRWLERGIALGPTVAAGVAYLMLRGVVLEAWFVQPVPHPLDNPIATLEGASRLATGLALASRAAFLLVFPVALSADYSGDVVPVESGLAAVRPLLGLVVVVSAALLCALPLLRRGTAEPGAPARVAISSALFLLPYLVIGNLLIPVGTIFAERLLYLPSAGYCLLLALLLATILRGFPSLGPVVAPERSMRRVGTVLLILLAAFGLRSWNRCHDWRDDERLFLAATRTQPQSPRAHFIVGKAREEAGDLQAAESRYRKVLDLWPMHGPAAFSLALIEAQRGDMVEAERLFRLVADLPHRFSTPSKALLNLGLALHRQGKPVEALRPLHRATLCRPQPRWLRDCPIDDSTIAKAWSEIGNVWLGIGSFERAATAYLQAVRRGWEPARPRLREARRRLAEQP